MVSTEIGRAAARRLGAFRSKAFARIGGSEDQVRFAIEPGEDVGRRTRGCVKSPPLRGFESGQRRLGYRRQRRRRGNAPRTRDGQASQLARLYLGRDARVGGEDHGHFSRRGGNHGGRRALRGYVQHVDLSLLHEKCRGQMAQGAGAVRGERERAGFCFEMAISSFTVRAGKDGCTASTLGA